MLLLPHRQSRTVMLSHQLGVEARNPCEHHCTKARGALKCEALLRRRAADVVLWR